MKILSKTLINLFFFYALKQLCVLAHFKSIISSFEIIWSILKNKLNKDYEKISIFIYIKKNNSANFSSTV